jgi:hypothetical protein
MRGIFFLSPRLVGVDTYVAFSYVLTKNDVLSKSTFVGFNRSDADQIHNNGLLRQATSEIGEVVSPQSDSFFYKLVFYLKLLKMAAHKDVRLFFYWPYTPCNIYVYLLYLVTRMFGGRGYVMSKSSSVVPNQLFEAWCRKYPNRKSGKCRFMKRSRNNDGVICFNESIERIVNNLIQVGCNFRNSVLEVSSPSNHPIWIEFAKRQVDRNLFTDNMFLLALAKVETSSYMADGNGLVETVRKVLGTIHDNFPDHSILVKPHPLDYQHGELMECFEVDYCTVLESSPLGYSFFAKRVLFVGPTNIVGLLSHARKIDFSVYKEFDDLYGGYNYINIHDWKEKEIIRLIEDDDFYDNSVSRTELDRFIGNPQADIERIRGFVDGVCK